jgi:hypothetical protein
MRFAKEPFIIGMCDVSDMTQREWLVVLLLYLCCAKVVKPIKWPGLRLIPRFLFEGVGVRVAVFCLLMCQVVVLLLVIFSGDLCYFKYMLFYVHTQCSCCSRFLLVLVYKTVSTHPAKTTGGGEQLCDSSLTFAPDLGERLAYPAASLPVEEGAGWAPEPVWSFWRREKYL